MLNYNGTLYADDAPILTAQNRAFRYGDGVWETMRCTNGDLPLYAQHIARMTRGLRFLQIELPDFAALRQAILHTVGNETAARVRLAVFRRADNCRLTPTTNAADFLITVAPLPSANFVLNTKLNAGICTNSYLQRHLDSEYAHLKLANPLPYILAANEKKAKNWDEVLICNAQNEIVEASSSNVILVREGKLYTTNSQQYGLCGTMQQHIIDTVAPRLGIATEQWSFHKDLLHEADEIILTNAIQGIATVQIVAGITKTYTHNLAKALHNELL
jgi:branched-chain amino acid aminotransferase